MKNKLIVVALLSWLGLLNFHSTASAQPVVTTLAATSITATNARLNGTVNPNGAATTAYFQYGLTTNYGSFSPTNNLAAGNTTLSVSNLISGLTPATTYHFRIVGANSFGADVGMDLTFTTAQVPTVVTASASGVTTTNATLNGTLLTGGLSTTAYFRFGLTTNYGSFSGTNVLAGTNTAQSVTNMIGGLSLNTTYHFQLVAINSAGSSLSGDFAFITAAAVPPIVTTLPATSITVTNVTLNGTAKPNGAATLAYFQYGLTTNYGYLGGFTNLPPETNNTLTLRGFAAPIRSAAGATWTQANAPALKTWTSIVSSADGTRLAAVCQEPRGAGIWTSVDGGLTWTQSSAPALPWQSIASSADGTRLAAAVAGGGIWITTNGGLTWTQTSAPATNWNTIVAAADGTRLAAAVNGGGIWTSTDGGGTWTQTSAPGLSWTSITYSADGRRLAAVVSGGGIYFSTDIGITWTQSSAPTKSWSGIASSADGSLLAAVAGAGGGIWTSTDGGVTWAMTSGPTSFLRSVVSSFDGMRLAALLDERRLWTSTDGGVTWTQASSPSNPGTAQSWRGIASSADGSRLAVASSYILGIWISTGAPSDLLAVTVYHYRAVGINNAGMGFGSDLTFTNVPLAPLVSSLAASGITATAATLSGAVNPDGAVTTAYFRYGVTTNYGSFSATNSLVATNRILSVSNSISSLMYGTPYHFQLVATNSAGSAQSGDFTFTTQPLPPVVTTLPATSITTTNATLNGTVNPMGGGTTAYFQYGLTTNYGYLGGLTNLPPKTNTTFTITGLLVDSIPGAAGATWTASSAPGGNWTSIASSADGTRLAAVQHEQYGRVHLSTDSGVTWNYTGGFQYWKSIASSADGTRLVAGANGGGIWTSTNGGQTWTQTALPGAWYSVACSADGMRMAGVNQSAVYTSVDGGLTWTQSGAPGANWLCIASSADGTRLAAGIYGGGGGIWTSADGGLTWTQTSAPGGNWKSIASSADGTRLAAGGSGGLLTSADGGLTWTRSSIQADAVASTADGLRLACVNGSSIWTSTDGGVTAATWSDLTCCGSAIASSADGTKMAAVIYGGGIYTSTAGAGSVLTPGTTCHYRLVGINSAGTTRGSDLTFTTSLAAPLVSTLAASGVTATTATLNGVVTPNGAATLAYFRYGLTTNYGSFSATNSLPATNATLLVSNGISSLAPATTYYYQLVCSNSVGTSVGAGRTFTTSVPVPVVATLAATGIAATNATLNGTVNPGSGGTATAYFQYGLTTNYGSVTPPVGVPMAWALGFNGTNQFATTSRSVDLANRSFSVEFWARRDGSGRWDVPLTQGTANPRHGLHVGFRNSNAFAFAFWGDDLDAPPSYSDNAWHHWACTYNQTNNQRVIYRDGLSIVSNTASGPYLENSPLLIARSAQLDANFGGALDELRVWDGARTPAQINAFLNTTVAESEPGLLAYWRFDDGAGASSGDSSGHTNTAALTGSPAWLAGIAQPAVSAPLTALAPGTLYHFRIVATNSGGSALGGDMTFTTAPAAPMVTTLAASGVSATDATLNGTVNPNGAATTAYFQYGPTTGYGSYSATNSLAATNATLAVTNLIGGLSPGATYHFRLVASNSIGIAFGADQVFGPPPHAFTGPGPGQGLDLQGNFLYAVNVGDNGAPGLIGDANFTADNVPGVIITAPGGTLNTINDWATPYFGATTDAVRLAQAMSSIRWTGAPGILTVNLDGLQVGRSYQLQLLFIENSSDRVFNVNLNGTTVVPNFRLLDYGDFGTAIVIPYLFTATGTSALIQLGGGTGENDHNPTLSAFTLEALAPAGTTPAPFSVAGSRSLAGGAFQLSFTNLSGLGFTVLGTTNVGLPLSNWTVLGAPTEAPAGQYQFTDSQTTNSPRRFYRVRSP